MRLEQGTQCVDVIIRTSRRLVEVNYSLLWKPHKLLKALQHKLTQQVAIRQAIKAGEKRFGGDRNYRPDLVTESFAPRPGTAQDDSAILRRIIAAYKKAKADQAIAGEAFNVSNEWLWIYERNLGPVMAALLTENLGQLQGMYHNFFRDPCSTGLVGLPLDMTRIFFRGRIKEKYQQFILCDVLHRYHLWKERTINAYTAETLVSPIVGNPYGYMIDGVFIRAGAEYQHYYAHAINRLLRSTEKNVVVELGGGFGGLAYYLLRDTPRTTYIDFDLPEALALASYYLMKALPELPITLYGEAEFTKAISANPGIFMMPSFEITKVPSKSIGILFNSYSLAEMSPSAIHTYIAEITRITSGFFLHVNHNRNAVLSADNFGVEQHGFRLISRELAGWTLGINRNSDEYEYLYKA
jgi:putative sugar O-methyltransferase